MNRIRKKRVKGVSWIVVFFTSILFLTISVSAQEAETKAEESAENQETFTLEEIVITASRRESQLMETPMAVWSITGEDLEVKGDLDIKTLYQSIPSMSYTANSETWNTISVRGLSNYAAGSSMVSVYVDEIPVTDQTSGGLRQIPGAFFDMERVEVLRGPQGTLYGEDNVSGTIRYITKDVDLDSFDFKARAAGKSVSESDDLGSLLQAVVNVPLIKDRLGVRIAAHFRDIPGIMDIGPPRSEKDVNTRKEKAVRLKLGWQATDDFRVTLTGDYVHSLAGGPGLADFPYGNDSLTGVKFPNGGSDTNKIANLTLKYNFGWAELVSSTSYFERDTINREETHPITIVDAYIEPVINWLYRIPGVSPFYIDGLPAGDAIESAGGYWDATTERKVQELRLVSTHGGNWSWSAGLFYYDSDMTSGRPGGGPWGMEYFPNPGFGAVIDAFYTYDTVGISEWSRTGRSAFAEVNYRFSDAWDLTVGGRFSQREAVTVEDYEFDDDYFSPKAVLNWRPREGLMLYGAVSQGFRAGVHNPALRAMLDDLRTWPLPVDNKEGWLSHFEKLVNTDGDEVISYELGLKTTLWDRVSLTTALFYMQWIDQITGVGVLAPHTGASTGFSVNAGESHSKGIELEGTVLLMDNLMLSFGGSLIEAELDKVEDVLGGFGQAAYEKGVRLPNAPEYTANVSLAYRYPMKNGWDIDARTDLSWVDKVRQNINETRWSTGVENTNARLSLTSPKRSWRFALYGENIFDKVIMYQSNIVGKYYGRPRAVGFEISYFLNP